MRECYRVAPLAVRAVRGTGFRVGAVLLSPQVRRVLAPGVAQVGDDELVPFLADLRDGVPLDVVDELGQIGGGHAQPLLLASCQVMCIPWWAWVFHQSTGTTRPKMMTSPHPRHLTETSHR